LRYNLNLLATILRVVGTALVNTMPMTLINSYPIGTAHNAAREWQFVFRTALGEQTVTRTVALGRDEWHQGELLRAEVAAIVSASR
jgi:hypothetical protein